MISQEMSLELKYSTAVEEVARRDTCKINFPSLLGVSCGKFESSKQARGGIKIKVR